jgi:hypothetical protein
MNTLSFFLNEEVETLSPSNNIKDNLLHNINVDENMIDLCETFIHLGMDVGI